MTVHWSFFLSFPLIIAYFIFPQYYLLKASPIWACAIAAGLQTHRYGRLVAVALLFGSVGDILLEMDSNYGVDLFVPGLACFLVGHLFYIGAFYQKLRRDALKFVLPPLVVYYGVFMGLLLPRVDVIFIAPIAIYALVLLSVVFFAGNRLFCFERIPLETRFFAVIGAIVFMVSDSLLSFNKFYDHFTGSGIAVMVTYYLAQLLLSASAQCELDIELNESELMFGEAPSKPQAALLGY